jgi:nucleotide-binding universal stress UspA family protein
MLHSILVPIDGSASSEQAIPLAIWLAARDGARLDLVLVTDRISPLEHARGAPVPDPRLDYELRHQKTAYLTTLAERIAREHSVRAAASVEEGPVAETLARHAAEADTDLVVMTAHHPGGIRPAWLSSTAAALVRRVNVPVLVVQAVEGPEPQAAEPFPPRRVLIALDGSEPAESILDAAVLVGGNEASYAVAGGVVPDPGEALTAEIVGFERDVTGDFRERLRAYLDEVARWLRGRGLGVETTILHGPDLASAIVDCAKAFRADLIAMAMRGRDLEERLVDGIVAEGVVRGASVPVLVRRPARTPGPVEASRG